MRAGMDRNIPELRPGIPFAWHAVNVVRNKDKRCITK